MDVLKRFIDKDSKKIYQPGDEYFGTEERMNELIEKGLLTGTDLVLEKEIVTQYKPEKVNVLFSKHKSKNRSRRSK